MSETLASSRKLRALKALQLEPLDNRTIARLSGLERSNARKAVRDLCRMGLVECLTPMRQRAKIYAVTAKGREVFERTKGKWQEERV